MRSPRSRCALAGAFLLAAAVVFISPPEVKGQSNFDRRVALAELRGALEQLLHVLEKARPEHGDQERVDEHRGHLRRGFELARHNRRPFEGAKDHPEKKQSEAERRRADENAEHRNRIGALPGRPVLHVSAQARARTTSSVFDLGRAKLGGSASAGAAEARPVRTLAPAGQKPGQAIQAPGRAKAGAGVAQVQAKTGAAKKPGNAAGNAAPLNANGAAPNQPADPHAPGVAKNEHHHHHHHFGEAKDAGQNGFGQQIGNLGMCKNGAGPQSNQGHAKAGNGANNNRNVAKDSSSHGNTAAPNHAAPNANHRTTNNATQAYVNQLLHGNGNRAGQQTHLPAANGAQRPQATPHLAAGSLTRSVHALSSSAQVNAGKSVGQHASGHPAHVHRK